jgi:SAM-dependent methyltransferase
MATIANTDMAAAWDGDEGAHWAANADRYERASARMWERFLSAVPIASDAAVLDIGCGTGRSTRSIAKLAADGSLLGVDLSARMLELARERAAAAGVTNARFEQADAQVHPFEAGAFDLAVSSFGCMFFADPVAAYRNIADALRPDGRLALLAWREMASNEWITAVVSALAVGRDLPSPPPHAPGPFAFADPDHVRRVLGEAGFADVELAPVDADMQLGDSADDAFSFIRTMGVTRGLTQDLDEDLRQRALDALRASVEAHATTEGVRAAGAAWQITARRAPD